MVTGDVAGVPASLKANHHNVFEAILEMNPLIASAHDVSDGGLLVAIVESAIAGSETIGATVDLSGDKTRADALLFGEAPARFVISFSPKQADALAAVAARRGVAYHPIGTTGGDRIDIKLATESLSVLLTDAQQAWGSGFADVAE